MATRSAETVIARPIGEVFAVLTNVENTGKWFPLHVEEQWTSAPPHGVGSTRHAVIHTFGRRSENDATITEYDPPHHGVIVVESVGMKVAVSLDFTEVEGGTRVRMSVDTDAQGLKRLVIGPFIRWYVAKWREGLVSLKAMMEAGQF